MKRHLFNAIIIVLFSLAGCGLDTTGRRPYNSIWLDSPLETETTTNTVVAITVHANYELSEVTISLRTPGSSSYTPYRTIPMTLVNASVYEGKTIWTPHEPGKYNLIATSTDGVISTSRYLRVLPAIEERSYPTPTAMKMPIRETITPAPTLPVTAPNIQFYADSYNLSVGSCTYIRWATVYIDRLYLNGEPVELMHSRQVCPAATTTYVLHGDYSGGSIEESITINVTPVIVPTTEVPVSPPPDVPPPPPPADTQGPSITTITKSAESIYDGTTCGVASNTITATVTDTSGVSEVVLWFRASKNSPATTGEWRSLPMLKTSSNNYQAILGPPQLSNSLAFYTDGTVEFYIIAKDSKGNLTQSGTLTFITILCLG